MSFETPNREEQHLPSNYIFQNAQELFCPPEKADLVAPAMPVGYIFPNERCYPLADSVVKTGNTIFNNYADNFMNSFQPDQLISDIDVVSAIFAGVELYQKGYKMVMGALVNASNESRTVAEILHMDLDCPNLIIIKYLQGGAMVAPYILFDTPDKKPFYGAGVGLWMNGDQISKLSE